MVLFQTATKVYVPDLIGGNFDNRCLQEGIWEAT